MWYSVYFETNPLEDALVGFVDYIPDTLVMRPWVGPGDQVRALTFWLGAEALGEDD